MFKLPGFAEKSIQNLIKELNEAKKAGLDRFLYALGIPHVGEHMTQVLCTNFKDLDSLMQVTADKLQEIQEIGPEVARSITSFFAEEHNVQAIARMRELGMQLENPIYKSGTEDLPLEGLTFVFTGTLQSMTRNEAQELVEKYGARASSSVSGSTDYLVAGQNAGSKLNKARDNNVAVLSEEEFFDFLESKEINAAGKP